MTIKFASLPIGASNYLKKGVHVKLELFQVLKHSRENKITQHSAILCAKLKIIGFSLKVVRTRQMRKAKEKDA